MDGSCEERQLLVDRLALKRLFNVFGRKGYDLRSTEERDMVA